MDAMTKILMLVDTRINGNQIKGHTGYENMLKSITKNDLKFYAQMDYGIKIFGTKLEMIEQLRNEATK